MWKHLPCGCLKSMPRMNQLLGRVRLSRLFLDIPNGVNLIKDLKVCLPSGLPHYRNLDRVELQGYLYKPVSTARFILFGGLRSWLDCGKLRLQLRLGTRAQRTQNLRPDGVGIPTSIDETNYAIFR